MQVMSPFIVYILPFSYLVVLISSKKLPPCDERDYYKIEHHRKTGDNTYEKLSTTLICYCNADRKRTEMTPIQHPKDYNIWIRNFRCLKAPKKQLSPCYEHQICKRKYFYDYGRDRPYEQYVDTTEDYCDCRDELECEDTGFLPKSIIYPYDNVLSYRCMPYIYEYDELKPCVRNQTYLKEIYRYKSFSGFDSIKLNTYMKCICETNLWTISQGKEKEDPTDDDQSIRPYTCPWLSRPSVEASCKDYAICRRGHETDVGEEEPDKWITYYFRIYCRCDQGRECLEVGKIEHQIIYRCFENKATNRMKNCKDGDISRVDIHKNFSVTRNGTAQNIEIKLNTIQMCVCSGNITWMGNYTIRYDTKKPYEGNEYIAKYKCEVHSSQEETRQPYCFKNEVCRINIKERMGIESGDSTFSIRSYINCFCSYPRSCLEAETPAFTLGIDRCTLTYGTEELRPCRYGELYKDVIYINQTRMNTIFLCKCDHILNEVYKDVIPISRDPRDKNRMIHSYFCPQPKNTTKELRSCKYNETCIRHVYEPYGEDVGSHDTFLSNSFTYCKCVDERYCHFSEKDRGKGNAIIATFRCYKRPCKPHHVCRIDEYELNENDWSREPGRNATLHMCHCTGECSYRPVHSIVFSKKFKSEMHYFTCKFPKSEEATTMALGPY